MASHKSDEFKAGSHGTSSSGKVRKMGADLMGLDITSITDQLDKHINLTRYQARQEALKAKRTGPKRSESVSSADFGQVQKKLRQDKRRDKGTTGGFGFFPVSEEESQEASHHQK